MIQRRTLMKIGAAGLACPLTQALTASAAPATGAPANLREIGNRPVLRRELLPNPVMIQSISVLQIDDQFMVCVRSTDGVEGTALCNPDLMRTLHRTLIDRIAPFFIKKDARDLHDLQFEAYFKSYKWQGLPFWSPFAWLELALLDLMGKTIGTSVANLIGNPVRRSSSLYYASEDRGSSAQYVIDELKGFVAESGSNAVKYRLGARLRTTAQSDARDRELIPLVRRELGDAAILYVDSNSSYDVKQALYFGRMLEEYKYGFFEEPVLFDDFDGTKAVAEGLSIPIAGGEIESSLSRFEYMIRHRVVQIVQPDLIYFGGLTRAIRVARMAEAAGMQVLPHMSDVGLGFLNVLFFAAVVPNTTDFQEYKGGEKVPYVVTGTNAPLRPIKGRLQVPQGPGLGVTFDPAWLAKAKLVAEVKT